MGAWSVSLTFDRKQRFILFAVKYMPPARALDPAPIDLTQSHALSQTPEVYVVTSAGSIAMYGPHKKAAATAMDSDTTTMNSNTDNDLGQSADNELGQSAEEIYGYEEMIVSPALFSADVVLTVPSCNSPSAKDYPPMPKERLARKQRSFGRRGGADHSALLKSAVLASLDFADCDSDEDACGGPRRSSVATNSDDGTQVEGPPASPRKRARFDVEFRKENEELAIVERASELFGTMCVGQLESEKPVRRVSRRRSYEGDDASPSTTCGLGDTRSDC
jgi:hypothetical protein